MSEVERGGILAFAREVAETNGRLDAQVRDFHRKLGIVAHCACCGREARVHQDHNHTNGLIRGRICQRCNSGLGFFQEDPKRLYAAVDYLRKWQLVHNQWGPQDRVKYRYRQGKKYHLSKKGHS